MNYLTFISEKLKPFKLLGETVFDNYATLTSEKVYPDRTSWGHWTYKGMNENEIYKLEVEIKKNIHDGYKSFLMQTNGMNVCLLLKLYGNETDYNTGKRIIFAPFSLSNANEYRFNFGERPINLSDDVLIIGSYGDDGSKIGILGSNGKVVGYNGDTLELYIEWSSFEEFFVSEFERIIEMFDTNGIKKDSEISTTPIRITEKSIINLARTDDYTFYKKPVRIKSKRDEW
jgi:SMI1-KNR4 cell-wall